MILTSMRTNLILYDHAGLFGWCVGLCWVGWSRGDRILIIDYG